MWKYVLFFPLIYTSWSDLHNAQSLEEFRSIIDDMRQNFPCEECRQDFNELVENHPYPVKNVKLPPEMRIWSWLTHNLVSKKIGKPWVGLEILNKYPLRLMNREESCTPLQEGDFQSQVQPTSKPQDAYIDNNFKQDFGRR